MLAASHGLFGNKQSRPCSAPTLALAHPPTHLPPYPYTPTMSRPSLLWCPLHSVVTTTTSTAYPSVKYYQTSSTSNTNSAYHQFTHPTTSTSTSPSTHIQLIHLQCHHWNSIFKIIPASAAVNSHPSVVLCMSPPISITISTTTTTSTLRLNPPTNADNSNTILHQHRHIYNHNSSRPPKHSSRSASRSRREHPAAVLSPLL